VDRKTRLRRTGILCLHFIRNAAYYRAWNCAPNSRKKEQFWRTLNGNFIDVCVLEWCKLFGDLRAEHHWSKCISEKASFELGLYSSIGLSSSEFEVFRIDVRTYRDKFVAHLDERNQIRIPTLQPALDSARYLYEYLLSSENDGSTFGEAPTDAQAEYLRFLEEGRAAHAS
jgi:hypothetical protein